MNLIDHEGFDDLRFDDRRADFNDRFVGEKDPSFGDRPQIAGKFQRAKIAQELFAKELLRRQVIERGRVKRESLQKVQNILQAGASKVAAIGWVSTNE